MTSNSPLDENVEDNPHAASSTSERNSRSSKSIEQEEKGQKRSRRGCCQKPKLSFKLAMSLFVTVYISIGVVCFCFVFEQWTLLDTIYFSVVTFTTVGYGDVSPNSNGGKLFNIAFVCLGHATIGIVLGYIGNKMFIANMEELRNKQAQAQYANDPVFGTRLVNSPMDTSMRDGSNDAGSQATISPIHRFTKSVGFFMRKYVLQSGGNSEREVQEDGTNLFSFVPQVVKTTIGFLLPLATVLTIGAVVIAYMEGWPWYDALYWCTMTGTTVGYGDFYPTTRNSKWFAIVFIPICVTLVSIAIGRIGNYFVEEEIEKCNIKLLQRQITLEDLEMMNADGDDEVTPLEFVEYFLLTMNKVDAQLLKQLHEQFSRLDVDGSGGLDKKDIELMTEKKIQSLLRGGSTEEDETENETATARQPAASPVGGTICCKSRTIISGDISEIGNNSDISCDDDASDAVASC